MKGSFVLYSGGPRAINKGLDQALVSMAGSKASVCYIPVTQDQDPKYYAKFKKYYAHYGLNKFNYLALDAKNSSQKIQKAFSSDVIYLDGGNTYELLRNIEASGLKAEFKAFLERGGILAGQSAGVIALSPNIRLAAIPSRDCDEPIDGFNKKKSLGLLPFEFSPHFDARDQKSSKELLEYSKLTKNKIFACDDGSGLVFVNNEIQKIGKVYCFYQGTKTII